MFAVVVAAYAGVLCFVVLGRSEAALARRARAWMTACFDARDGFQGPRVPCAASKQVGVHQCPNGGPLLWRLPYAPDIWGTSGDCTYGYCTDPNTAAAASYGNRGVPQNRSKQ